MAVIEGGVSALLMGVGEETAKAGHSTIKPIPYGALGHYRVGIRINLVAAQAANSRLFTFRNTHVSNLMILTRLNIRWLQTAAHTAAIEDSIDCFKLQTVTVDDTVNTVTPAVSRKRTSMAPIPGSASIRHVTVAGASAGMTGGTMTKDGSPFAQLPKWLLAALPTTDVPFSFLDALDDVNGTHPFAFAQSEGFEIENRVLLGAAAGSAIYLDVTWAEVTAY